MFLYAALVTNCLILQPHFKLDPLACKQHTKPLLFLFSRFVMQMSGEILLEKNPLPNKISCIKILRRYKQRTEQPRNSKAKFKFIFICSVCSPPTIRESSLLSWANSISEAVMEILTFVGLSTYLNGTIFDVRRLWDLCKEINSIFVALRNKVAREQSRPSIHL